MDGKAKNGTRAWRSTPSANSRQLKRSWPQWGRVSSHNERWHQTMKNRILLENYYLPGDLEQQIGAFVDHYNNHRYHESLNNVIPADVYFGRDKDILREREKIKKQTIQYRRLQHQRQAA